MTTLPPLPTRQRLIRAMSRSIRLHGLHATGLSEVLRDAAAPKGVLYYHFPSGKTGLAIAALQASVERLVCSLDEGFEQHPDPFEAVQEWVDQAARSLDSSNYQNGCPLATVALESTAADVEIRQTLGEAFALVRGRIEAALMASGYAPAEASGVATLIVAVYEGGLLQSRVAGSVEPLHSAMTTLRGLIEATRRATT